MEFKLSYFRCLSPRAVSGGSSTVVIADEDQTAPEWGDSGYRWAICGLVLSAKSECLLKALSPTTCILKQLGDVRCPRSH